MGLCRQCTFFNKRYGFISSRYGFQSKCTFQRLTPVDPPGKSYQWGVLAVAPGHVACNHWQVWVLTRFWPGAQKYLKCRNGVWIWYGF